MKGTAVSSVCSTFFCQGQIASIFGVAKITSGYNLCIYVLHYIEYHGIWDSVSDIDIDSNVFSYHHDAIATVSQTYVVFEWMKEILKLRGMKKALRDTKLVTETDRLKPRLFAFRIGPRTVSILKF